MNEKDHFADIDHLITEQDHFLWYWSSNHWKLSFPLLLIISSLNKIIFADIDRLMTENDHFADIESPMTENDHFSWYRSFYDRKTSFRLLVIVLWLKMIISFDIDRLMTEQDPFR
jgi:hypothetical protein